MASLLKMQLEPLVPDEFISVLAGFLVTEKGDYRTIHYAINLDRPLTDTFLIISANRDQREPG